MFKYIKSTFDLSKPINRIQFLCGVLFWIFIFMLFVLIVNFSIYAFVTTHANSLLEFIVIMVFLIPLMTAITYLSIKRLKDIGINSYYSILIFVPVIGYFFILYLLLKSGKVKAIQ